MRDKAELWKDPADKIKAQAQRIAELAAVNVDAETGRESAGCPQNPTTNDRTGYCAWCKHNPGGSIVDAAADVDTQCYGCWFSEEKPNWEVLDKARGQDYGHS